MTAKARILAIVDALGLPPEARLNARVPKKLLAEQGAPTAADKRAIQGGIDDLQWFAACKPTTIGVPTFADETREYLEIAGIACEFRPRAKVTRLVELIHRAIPYPVVLVAASDEGTSLSLAHKRRAQNAGGKMVIEPVVSVVGLSAEHLSVSEVAFLRSLALAKQTRYNLHTLYEGWLTRLEALNAARLNGKFTIRNDETSIERRREALEAHCRLTREIIGLRAKANREKQVNRRVDLNLKIQRLQAEVATQKRKL